MTATPYTTAAAVAAYLGVNLNSAQATQATALATAATTTIDGETRRTWQRTQIVGEEYDLWETALYLRTTPVSTIDLVTWRTRTIGDVPQTLVAGQDYELQNAATGLVMFLPGYVRANRDPLPSPSDWGGPSAYTDLTWGTGVQSAAPFVLVTYTPAPVVPADIAQAATMLAAHWLRFALDPDRYGLTQYKLGEELEIRTDDVVRSGDIPIDVQRIIADNRRAGIFA